MWWCEAAGVAQSTAACAIACACATSVIGANSTITAAIAATQRRTIGGRRIITAQYRGDDTGISRRLVR